MLHALVSLAAAEEEHSKVPFFLFGSSLAAFALVVSAIGISQHAAFPATKRTSRALMGIALLLVAGAITSAVLTAG